MNYLVVCTAFLIGAQAALLSDEVKAKIKEVHLSCMKKTNVDPAVVEKAKKGEYEDNDALKDQILCFTQTLGFQDADGKFQTDKVKEHIVRIIKDENIAENIVKECIKDKEIPKESAFQAAKCLHKLAPKDESVFD